MSLVEINDLHSIGAVADVPGYMLPPEAWTLAHNMRWRDKKAQKMQGHSQIFGTPGVAPHFAIPISALTQSWLLYTSLTKGYVWDGANHTDITRAVGGDYNAADTRDWNGTIIGGIPILNNGTDVPQYWSTYSAGTKLAALPNWPGTWRARNIKALGPHLIAIGVTKSGTVFPHLVVNSHPATAGSVPSSWDVTDPTKDARENDLPDVESGVLTTLLPLRGAMYLYKESSIWRMRFIGGRFQFSYDTFLETAGSFVVRGVCALGDGLRHVVWGQEDIIIHDGQSAQSILDEKWKTTLFKSIDQTNYRNCFCFCSPDVNEIWFCYPELGQTQPNKALVWNYKYNTFTTSDVGFRNAVIGTVETSDAATWDSDNDSWDSDQTSWNDSSRRKVIILDTDHTKFHQFNNTETRDGSTFTATLQRTGLAIIGRKRTGEPIVDFQQGKFVNKLWIKAAGGPIGVRLGSQDLVDGPVSWTEQKLFDPSIDTFVDFTIGGRAIAVEFETTTGVTWDLQGYKLDVTPLGNY